MSNNVCLQYVDRTKPVTLHIDASKVRLGVVLIQKDTKDKPTSFASKILTPAETRYANIEHEMFAVGFGCIKYHHYMVEHSYCIKALHNCHPVINKILLQAETNMFWPSNRKQMAEYVHSCAPCTTIRNSQQKEPAIPTEVPSRLWKVLDMEFFMHKSKWFLIVTDY